MSLRISPVRVSFFIPALILTTIFVIYPVIATILLSFNINPIVGSDIVRGHASFENYAKLLSNRMFINPGNIEALRFPMGAIIHNIIWIAIHLPLTLIIGILFASLLQYVRGGSIIRSFIFVGMVVPMIVGGLLILFSFDKDLGIVNLLLNLIGLGSVAKTWTAYPDTALFSLILGSAWLWSGFSVTIYSAGISSLPREVMEAAIVDGARFGTILFRIIIPMLKPVTLTVVAMTIIWDLKIFDIVFASTQGGPGGASTVLAILMYDFFARANDYAMSAAVATILTLVILPAAIIWIRSVVRGVRS